MYYPLILKRDKMPIHTDEITMDSREIVQVEDATETVGCNGGGGALGHPLVYLIFDRSDAVDCYYCSRHFAKARALKPKSATEEH